MIYKLRADRSHYLNAYLSPDEVEARIGDYFLLDEPEWKDFWQPMEITFQDDSDKRNVITPPDITLWFTSNNLILNQKAYAALKDELAEYGELLPVSCEGVPYWLCHVTMETGTDAVDLSQSDRFVDEGEYVNLKKLAFKEQAVKDLLMFQSEYTGFVNLYCTDRFKTLLQQHDLRGLLFLTDLISII